MSKFFKLISIVMVNMFLFSIMPYVQADTLDRAIPVTEVTITGAHTLTVNIRNIVGGAIATGVTFGTRGTLPWRISEQYLEIIPSSNYPLWAVRIVSDNNAAGSPYAGMFPKQIDDGLDGSYATGLLPVILASDDSLSYGGLIDAASRGNPNNRGDLVWQVYEDPVADPATLSLVDASLYGRDAAGVRISSLDNWNADWAAVVDRSNSQVLVAGGPRTTVPIGPDPDGNYRTITYSSIVQGGPSSYGMNYHPITPTAGDYTIPMPNPGDADGVIAYLGARIGGLAAGTYGVNGLMVQFIHE